jgi:crotonobetaine/carnitine-CoA ligase
VTPSGVAARTSASFEVEALVAGHDGVAECAAIPVPSEWGEDEVKVCVVRADSTLTEEQLLRDLILRMPRFMVPRYVEFVDHLPKTDARIVRRSRQSCSRP